jgi:L-lysine 2,3-aminomutase
LLPESCDLAPGTAHLRTMIAEGQALMRRLRGRVSGLCQPEYVLDIPGGHAGAAIAKPSRNVNQIITSGIELAYRCNVAQRGATERERWASSRQAYRNG